jgi:N-acetylneuraminate synthase/N,N'-diacetyllegionaminate synthase
VIAELGVNHDGSLDRALALTEAAAEAGADAVKLQLFDPEALLSADAELADYQSKAADDPHAMLRGLTLEADEMARVRDRAHELALGFVVTCFSLESIPQLEALGPDAVKIASPDCVNRPLIEAVGGLNCPRLISTGAATGEEVGGLLGRLAGDPTALLLACVSAYPTPAEAASLERIAHLLRFADRVGYSDHTTGVMTGALAVAAGASVIEKHLTWDTAAAGPDHAASLDPAQFAGYVAQVRQAERMRGERWSGEVLELEADVRRVSRQSVCVNRDLPAGHSLTREDLTVKRPGTGVPAGRLDAVVGRRLAQDVSAGRMLRDGDLRAE